MRFIYLVFLLLFFTTTYGQVSIVGKITDVNKIALKYSTIELRKDSVLIATINSDSLGNYKFLNLKTTKYSISVSYLNYEKSRLSFTLIKDTIINFQLKNMTNMLAEVVVSSKQPSFVHKGDRFVFIPNNMLAQGNSGIDVLQHTPLIKFDGKSEVFSILNKKTTIIYINNKKVRIPNEMVLEMLKALPAENIKSVEIITNPGSEYDANITGGIININIKRQVYEGWLGNLSLSTQQSNYNTTILNGSINYRKGKIAFQIIPFINDSYNYTTRQNDLNYNSGLSEKLSSNSYRRYYVAGGGINFDYDINTKNSLSYKGWISHVNGNSVYKTTTAYSKSTSNSIDSLQSAPYKGNDTYLYNFGNINYHRTIDSKATKYLDVNIDYNQFTQKNIYNGSFDRLDNSGNVINEISRYKNQLPQNLFNLSEKIEYGQSIDKTTKLIAGLQYSNTHVTNNLNYQNFAYISNTYNTDSLLTNNYSYKEIYSAAFFSLNKNFSSKVSASVGLRVENTHYKSSEANDFVAFNNLAIDTSYINLFPSAALSYSANEQNQFTLSYSKKITRPGIELLFPGITYYSKNYFNENNPFLQPIIYYNEELNYTLKGKYNFIFDYSVSDHAYSNFTIPTGLNSITMLKSTYLNYGTARSFDFTINANVTLLKNFWDSQITPSIDYSSYKSTIPEVSLSINNFNYNFLFDNTIYISKLKKWTGFATLVYTSAIADISGRKVNANSHLDIGIKKVISSAVSVSFFANDIYKGNAISKYYQTTNPLLSNNYLNTNSYTRSFTVRLRVKFGNSDLKQNREHKIANDELKSRTGQ